MVPDITFGTDGWRAVIADGYTFDNVRRVSDAIAVAARGLEPPPGIDRNTLIVGFDRRFLGGIVVTASHNPAKYNGIKFKAWYGGSALPETYAAIASALGHRDARAGGSISEQDI